MTCNHIKGVTARMKGGHCKSLKNLVIMDEKNITDEQKKELEGIKWYTLQQVIDAGKEEIQPLGNPQPDDIAFFSYTSGTTGKPKGAMISHRNVLAGLAGASKRIPITTGIIHLSYLPLAHVMERLLMSFVILFGGKYGLFGGNVRKLKEDLAVLKPNIFVSVPRLFNKFYDAIQSKMRAATCLLYTSPSPRD